MTTPSVDDIARLCDLVTTHRLDSLEFEGVRIVKSLHAPLASAAQPTRRPSEDDDDELLYASSDA